MVTRDLSSPYKTDGRGKGSQGRPFHCACCTPARQIYYRAERPVDRAYHEADPARPRDTDHTPAEVAVSQAAQRRMRRRRA